MAVSLVANNSSLHNTLAPLGPILRGHLLFPNKIQGQKLKNVQKQAKILGNRIRPTTMWLPPDTVYCSIGVRSVFDWCSIRVRFNLAPINAQSIPSQYPINTESIAQPALLLGSRMANNIRPKRASVK